ncbi:SOS response-associated peptidase [Caulobacter sp. KR2-114]|uniref:SOS response-associated peptidase n=1 Tax=Caulobacter sp. KR2-114 TaxID=3400912 RepID=UPI003C110074
MCNKFGFNAPLHRLIELFAALDIDFEAGGLPNFPGLEEIKPTDLAPVVRQAGEGRAALSQMRWGFPPGRPKAGPVINYRAEGRTFASGRCLVPATHFFEFTGVKYPKTQWRFTAPEADVFAMAGLWRDAGEAGERFTLLTIDAGPDVAPYHDRQIVPLTPDQWKAWLDPAADAQTLLKAAPAGSLTAVRVVKGAPPTTARLF